MTENRLHSNIAIPPGEFLEEVIYDLGMTKDDFANRMNRPAAKLSQIFNGVKTITPDTALQIEKVTNVPAHIWTGLESTYRLTLARIAQEQQEDNLKNETHLITAFCYAELVKLGFVKKYNKAVNKVRELQSFFGVTSLHNLNNLKRYAPLYRHQEKDKNKVSPEAITSWLRMGEIRGSEIECSPYSESKVFKLVKEINKIILSDSDNLKEILEEKFAAAGIALVIVPHLPKTYAHGAAFWIKDKPVIMVTIRKSWADIFWFSLLHEIGHIVLHNKSNVYIESDKAKFIADNKETEASDFASAKLIPAKEYKKFKAEGSFYYEDIIEFAEENNIHPGIVVGRLQHEKLIEPSWHNDLRCRFKWK